MRFIQIFRRAALGLISMAAHLVSAQTLEGDWFYRGFYAEAASGATSGTQVRFEHELSFGTFDIVSTGGDNYRITIVDNTGIEVYNLTLTRSGNVYTGVLPNDAEPGMVMREEVQFILDGDVAYVSALTWDSFTDGRTAGSGVSGYVLSRNDFPAQDLSRWTGNYEYRLGGQLRVGNPPSWEDAVDVAWVRFDANDEAIMATYQGSTVNYTTALSPNILGLVGQNNSPIPGNSGSSQVAWDEARTYSMAVQINATEIIWLQTFSTFDTVNAGTNSQYSSVLSTSVLAGRASPTVDIAPTISRQPADVSVLTGGDAFFSVDATGAPAPTYDWETSSDGGMTWNTLIDFDPVNFSGANTATLVVKAVAAADGQRFRVTVENSAGELTSNTATYETLTEPTARLPNLSVRTTLAEAQNLAVGFVMTGGSKPLLIRAVGPTLGDFGVGDAMPDPRIGFNNPSGIEIAANDDWAASLTTTFSELGAFALVDGSKDAALRVDLSGLGTVSVNGPTGGTVLVELYDIGDNNDTRLANVSARNFVGTGDNILIAGFVVAGADPKNMLIRAVGPGLEPYLGSGFLGDPLLKIFDAENNVVATNDNWSPSLQPSFDLTGAFSISNLSLDAAIVLTLPPGQYTAQVSGADGGTGQAIVEIYELP